MFHGKCYICENKEGISSFQIEHLKPHRENADLKYDWNNLFWSCAHCNNIKNAKYDPILDCTQVEVDRKIAFRKEGYFGIQKDRGTSIRGKYHAEHSRSLKLNKDFYNYM